MSSLDSTLWLAPFRRVLLLALLLGVTRSAPAQMTPDQAASLLLNSARRAYNEKNFPVAIARFKEFLDRHGNHKEAGSARYGLALCLIEGPQPKYAEAVALLQPLAGDKNQPDHPFILYYLGHAQRKLGSLDLAQAREKPQEAAQWRQRASQKFEDAAGRFAAASAAFLARAPKPQENARELPVDHEWAIRSRCDQAEMLLRLGKIKEARELTAAFLSDALLAKSRYRRLGLYHHGFACFSQGDWLTAGKALNQLTPFTDPVFGTHARYLLARVHHQDGERAEAAGHYAGVIADHDRAVKDAQQILRNPQALANNAEEKARLQALIRSPAPDHVARAHLYLGVMHYEDGKFGESLSRFADFLKAFPTSPLAPEVQLRLGFCQVQLKAHADAVKTLQPLVEKAPALADQALLWIAKAQSGSADPANPANYVKAQKEAVETLKKALDRVKGDDPPAKSRRGLILLETIDVLILAQMYRESAELCQRLLNDRLLPDRGEEILHRQATALHLAGDYAGSDRICEQFRQAYPKSTLLPAIAFRSAENAAFTALAAEKNANLPDRVNTLNRLHDEAAKRYQHVVEKYPEFAHVSLARLGLGLAHYRKNDLEKALQTLEAIPVQDRVGQLGIVPYVLADCLMRTAPAEAEDALAAGKLSEHMTRAIELLNAHVGAVPRGEQTPDALLKLGHCYLRLAEVQAQPQAREASLQGAKNAFDNLVKNFPQSPLVAQAIFERARYYAIKDFNRAVQELKRFETEETLKKSKVAPMALLRLATLLRSQNRAAEAVTVLVNARKNHEAELRNDPERASWVALLHYHHGLALKETGKLAEARALFEGVVKNHAGLPEALEAALRLGQCLKDEAGLKIADARRKNDARALQEGQKALAEAVKYLESQAEGFRQKQGTAPARARMYYDAAWAARTLAEMQIEEARQKIQGERWQKLKELAQKKTPQGRPVPSVPMPEVALGEIPVQDAEKKARELYGKLIAEYPDLETNADARFELAELLSQRDEHDAAIKLLQDALDREPGPELTERITLRLGASLAARGDTAAALKQLEKVARNARSPLRFQAIYRVGECLMQMKKFDEAVKVLVPFRDDGNFRNIPGVSDRAVLRLAHALGELKQWDASRQTHEAVISRYERSPWVAAARYGIGWAQQNKGEYDAAVQSYEQVTRLTATELAARAQINIGLCRLAQKRYGDAATALLVVPLTYDYPALNATALLEAARALAEDRQKDKAIKILKRLLQEHPDTDAAEAAKKRIEELEKS